MSVYYYLLLPYDLSCLFHKLLFGNFYQNYEIILTTISATITIVTTTSHLIYEDYAVHSATNCISVTLLM